MKIRIFIFFILFLLLPVIATADYLEIKQNTPVFKEPDKNSERISYISLKGYDGPYLVKLQKNEKVNGFYKIRLRGKTTEAWIYKTMVRRIRGQHDNYIPYERKLYKHWIDEDSDCQNTRDEVLIRDDDDQIVKYKSGKECQVVSGTWVDPYTGETLTKASQLDVDHVVPLKNAHESGAWAWSSKKRAEYANFLSNNKHLLAVKASENRKKADKGPDKYLPPKKDFQCAYVKTWVSIKEDWELEMTSSEENAVSKVLANCSN